MGLSGPEVLECYRCGQLRYELAKVKAKLDIELSDLSCRVARLEETVIRSDPQGADYL